MDGDGAKGAAVGRGDLWAAISIVTSPLITDVAGGEVHWAAALSSVKCQAASLDSSKPPSPTPEASLETVFGQLPATHFRG